jgi:hypothetical protein
MNRKLLLFLLVMLFPAGAKAAPAEILQYNALVKAIESSKEKQSLQGFFYIAKELEEKGAAAKTRGFEAAGQKNILSPQFLSGMAKKNGEEEDIKFFEAYKKFTDSQWPDPWHPYMETNSSGLLCINTSSHYLYDFYAGWLKYLGGFPGYDYIGTLDIYQSYATEQLTMYEFHLVKFPYCESDKAKDDIENFIGKVKNNQDDTNMRFSKRVISAIKTKRP